LTTSSRFNRRKVAALGIAFASLSALAITTSPAQADIGPAIAGVAGDVRVLPRIVGPNGLSTVGLPGADGLDQPAPAVALGTDAQPAASAQIRIHNQWRSGDRVLFQVRDSAGNNCANVPKSIGYAAVPTVVSSSNAYSFVPGGDVPFKNNVLLSGVDVATVTLTPAVRPEFQVNLISSTQCAPNNVTDIVEIIFTNESAFPSNPAAVATDAWLLTVAGVAYNVGAEVTAGPLRNLPFAQNGTGAPGIFNNSVDFFGANEAAIGGAPMVQDMWTTTAFVLPVSLAAVNPIPLVGDGFTQNLGTITLKESVASGFRNDAAPEPALALRTVGTYQVCYGANIGNVSAGVTATGIVPGSIVIAGKCISFNVRNTDAVDTVTLSNIFAPVNDAGQAIAFLSAVPIYFQTSYLVARDSVGTLGAADPVQASDPSSSLNSDVNSVTSPILVAPVSVAAALPNRIGGANRFETAVKIAGNVEECNDEVVLVNGSSFPDALSATYLAGALSSRLGNDPVPILLTNADSIPAVTLAALREMGVENVHIVGGTAAVSQQVEDQLLDTRRYNCGGVAGSNDQDITVDRYDGANRYATNNAVIEAAQSVLTGPTANPGTYNNRIRYQATASQPSKRTAIVATGEKFADALTAGPVAYNRFPLILTTGGTLSPEALQSMISIDVEQVVIFGGESAVSAEVATAIEARGITVIRLAGADRYATSVAVNNWALAPTFPGAPAIVAADLPYDLGLGLNPGTQVFMVRGDGFADALAAAPMVGQFNSLLTLTERNTLSVPTKAFLVALNIQLPAINQVVAIGLGSAISSSVLAEANATVN